MRNPLCQICESPIPRYHTAFRRELNSATSDSFLSSPISLTNSRSSPHYHCVRLHSIAKWPCVCMRQNEGDGLLRQWKRVKSKSPLMIHLPGGFDIVHTMDCSATSQHIHIWHCLGINMAWKSVVIVHNALLINMNSCK
jgi:hypothetical protein